MPGDPHKLVQFWQELKRRKVIKALAMYTATAFIIMEAADIMLPRLGLADWTVTLIIILLIIGFPIAMVLSWLFDLTSEGIKRTAKVRDVSKTVTPKVSAKRGLKISDIIIAVLLIIVSILAFPRIFPSMAGLNAMTRTVTVINELGEKESRRVFKEDYISNLAIFPFKDESSDTMNNWVQYGIPDALYRDLLQFNYVLVVHNDVPSHLQAQIEYATTNNISHFLTGSYNKIDGKHEITSKLYLTITGRLVEERVFRGSDFFNLIDSISLQARIDLGISEKVLNSFPDLPVGEQLTYNLDAFRHFETGEIINQAWGLGYPINGNRNVSWRRAFELDSTFALASWRHAYNNYIYHTSDESARKYIDLAMRHCSRLSELSELQVKTLYYLIHGDNEKAIALAELQYDLQPSNINLLEELINVYQINFMIQEVESATEQLNKLVPNFASYQIQLARSYLLTGKLQKGIRVLGKLLKDNPENTNALMKLGQLHLHDNDLDAAEKSFQKAILLSPEYEERWVKILEHINYIRGKPISGDFLEQFECIHRYEWASEFPHRKFIHNKHLFGKPAHQRGWFRYPVSDSVFINLEGWSLKTFHKDDRNKVSKILHRQFNLNFVAIDWIEDSMISQALNLLENGTYAEALAQFRLAYKQNPEHYYLGNYIQHLEFIEGQPPGVIASTFEPLLGQYGTVKLYSQNGQYYYESEGGFIHKLLPLNAYQFMVPNRYPLILQIEVEDNAVIGLTFVYRDGGEQFYPRVQDIALADQNQ
jgi:tetratricopeptide (TPR) repeat protein